MILVMWEYQVKADRAVEFERIYHSGGTWAKLFKQGSGYLGTELLRNEKHPQRYITIDQWTSSEDYESFLSQWKKEYEALDAQCEGFTERETLLGNWESIKHESR